MSGIDGLQLDPDGYLDMDQFPDDGTDLADADLASLRDTLHADPVDEPSAEQWDAMFDEVITTGDTGPFALEDVDGLVSDDGVFSDAAPASDDVVDDISPDDDLSADDDLSDDDGGIDLDAPADDLDLDLDLDVDVDGGLDLAADDGVDDAFAVDALDDGPAEVANNDFEDLL